MMYKFKNGQCLGELKVVSCQRVDVFVHVSTEIIKNQVTHGILSHTFYLKSLIEVEQKHSEFRFFTVPVEYRKLIN